MSYEQSIKEARTIEAMKNGYMGLGGKFGQITKKLGHPIINQGGMYKDSTEFENVLDGETEDLPTMDESEASYEIGWQFDGLSRGVNLSILIFNHLREIKVVYEGRVVYKEVSGELESYAPDRQWEDWVGKLADLAKKIQRRELRNAAKEAEKAKEEKRNEIIEDLKKRWGI